MKKIVVILMLIWGSSINAQHLDFNDSASESFFVSDNGNNDLDVNSQWTFEAWVIVDNRPSGTYPVIMNRRYGISMYVQACTNCSGDYSIAFVRRNSNDAIIASMNSNKVGENLQFDTKVHIAASRDASGTARLFINGNEVDSSTDGDFVLANSVKPINFGARYFGSYQRHLDGEIDEIRISDIARYTSNFTPVDEHTTDGNTRLLLHLNEGSGTDIADASGNFSGLSLTDGDQVPDWVDWSIPIELKSFTAKEDNGSIELNWITASEINNKGFEIQRSNEGKDWEVIGFVDGQGDSRGENNYVFTDKSPEKINYYRLNQIDFDGNNNYSNVVFVELKKDNRISVFPNPTNDFLNVTGLISYTDYYIYDKLGKVVSTGETSGKIDVSGLVSGVYYMKTGEESKAIKFVVK